MTRLFEIFLSDPTVTFCEQPTGGFIERPWYFLSNIPYLVVGIYLLIAYKNSRVARVFGFAAIAIGVFSSLYDLTYTYGSQLLDLGGMFFFVVFLITLNIQRIRSKSPQPHGMWFSPLLITIISLGVLLWVHVQKGFFGNYAFAALVVTVFATEYLAFRKNPTTNYTAWRIAIIIFLLGSAVWVLDGFHLWCSPVELFNGRAIFHYTTSITIIYLASFYRQTLSS